ncbi:MAG: hypothetical protein PWP16_1104 [Eubacteriaceae bacterium]|jgi:hypothetical protein|nr:hypothetical protein [Eubacteriaceae bacterium]MDK2936501.1 hypothetical protein [Eubacteriaceae bacterium]MDK2962551.1 hypothetical protein [Eubacteriaceae bacterium]MDN5307741.1 hypothetical protein [Eubacteriaceae bacterium]
MQMLFLTAVRFVDKPRTDNWISQSARGFVQLLNLKVLINNISEQLFAPRQTAEKPIVGAQVLKIAMISI